MTDVGGILAQILRWDHPEVVGLLSVGHAIVGRDVEIALVKGDTLRPRGLGAQVKLALVFAIGHIIRVNEVATHPICHPHEACDMVEDENS